MEDQRGNRRLKKQYKPIRPDISVRTFLPTAQKNSCAHETFSKNKPYFRPQNKLQLI